MTRLDAKALTRRGFFGAAGAAAAAAALPSARAVGGEPPAQPQPPFRRSYVTVDGVSMFAAVSEVGQGPPLVLVHGMGLSGRYMMPVAYELAPYYPVYVPDFPGFGDSGKPPYALDVPGMADALAGWMEAAGVPRAALLGNSFGCQIIGDLAARHPERVERAVLQGPTSPPEERTWIWQFIRWQQNSPYNPPEMGEIAGSDYIKAGPARLFLTFQYSIDDRLDEKLPHVEAPMLVVRGALDPICRQDWAEKVTRLLPDGRLIVLPKVAHTLVFTAPEELAEASRPFLDEAA